MPGSFFGILHTLGASISTINLQATALALASLAGHRGYGSSVCTRLAKAYAWAGSWRWCPVRWSH